MTSIGDYDSLITVNIKNDDIEYAYKTFMHQPNTPMKPIAK